MRLRWQTAATPRPAIPSCQQILTILAAATGPPRAKEVCQATNSGTEARHIEATASKLKKLLVTMLVSVCRRSLTRRKTDLSQRT